MALTPGTGRLVTGATGDAGRAQEIVDYAPDTKDPDLDSVRTALNLADRKSTRLNSSHW